MRKEGRRVMAIESQEDCVFRWSMTTLILGMFLGMVLGWCGCCNARNLEAIERGLMEYNPKTGQLDWVED